MTERQASRSAWLSLSGTSLLHQQAQRCDNHTTYSPFIIISFSFLALKGLLLQGPSLSDCWHTTRLVPLSVSSPVTGEQEREKRQIEVYLLNKRRRQREGVKKHAHEIRLLKIEQGCCYVHGHEYMKSESTRTMWISICCCHGLTLSMIVGG